MGALEALPDTFTTGLANRASCEFDAVRLENRYRKTIGICERITYGIFQVPDAERTCAAKEEACRPFTGCSDAE